MLKEDGEVILCAGAIGSPQLLLLSGIGPRPYLSSWGIPVVRHSAYVGNYMYDNPRNGISIVSPVPLEHSLIQVVGITDSVDQTNHVLMGQFCRRTVSTIWHYHGGCVVGRVVDRNLKVSGVNSLRVVDGSTFTVSPGTNPQATLLMLGRYMGMKILRERMRKSSD
uniref:(R)-mandelonitrile lyase-like n=1 Tax=Tanacetum cinerariifolium TaxID=118510 RepID=A0A6L2MVW2_TANCI|nr:(R)-mandelonitrile lyase-like [Tanacetum cinerariifolium]